MGVSAYTLTCKARVGITERDINRNLQMIPQKEGVDRNELSFYRTVKRET